MPKNGQSSPLGDILGHFIKMMAFQPQQQQQAAKPSPEDAAVQEAMKKYPFLKRLGAPLSLTQGSGPYESESYTPESEDNPTKGHYTVQLRSEKAKKESSKWPALLGSEGLDFLARKDPTYQGAAKQFRDSMTPDQLAAAKEAWQRERKEHGETRDFEGFLKEVQIQEYMRGYLFPEAAPGWTGSKGEGQYSPQQTKLLDNLKSYLNRP